MRIFMSGFRSSVTYAERIPALFYLLGGWLILRAPDPKRSPLAYHSFQLAQGLFFLLLCIGVSFLATAGVLTFLIVNARNLYEGWHLELYTLSFFRKVMIVWLVFWAYACVQILRGQIAPLPLVPFFVQKPTCMVVSRIVWRSLLAVGLVVSAVAWHASRMASSRVLDQPVVFLYEDGDRFPRALFALAFYPALRAARARFGENAAAVVHVSRESVREALKTAQFLFIGSHGQAQGMLLRDGWLSPDEVKTWPRTSRLQFVYMTSCDSGVQRKRWEDAFAPARVVTYDRLTTVWEHTWWLVWDAPEIIASLPQLTRGGNQGAETP